jgi:hypothetical protein
MRWQPSEFLRRVVSWKLADVSGVLLPILECLTGNPLFSVLNCGVRQFHHILIVPYFSSFPLFHFLTCSFLSWFHNYIVLQKINKLAGGLWLRKQFGFYQQRSWFGGWVYGQLSSWPTSRNRTLPSLDEVLRTFRIKLVFRWPDDHDPICFHLYPTSPACVPTILSSSPSLCPSSSWSPFLIMFRLSRRSVWPAPVPQTASPRSVYSWPSCKNFSKTPQYQISW